MKNNISFWLFLIGFIITIAFIDACKHNPVSESENNNGNPNIADTSFSNFIIVNYTSGNDTLIFSNNSAIGYYNSGSSTTGCIINDNINNAILKLGFHGNTTGNPSFIADSSSLTYGLTYQATSIIGTVTFYGPVGSIIKGTFNGSYLSGSQLYTGRGEFTVRRIQ